MLFKFSWTPRNNYSVEHPHMAGNKYVISLMVKAAHSNKIKSSEGE